MVIAIILLLLLVCSALIGALYMGFTMFFVNFSDTLEYNKAYYAAVAGLERAELVLRYKSPGFQGSGGWLDGETFILNGYSGDLRPNSDFSYLGKGGTSNGIKREINSRTKKIPNPGEGNVDWMLATGDSLDFNRLDYLQAMNVLFMMDSGNSAPYMTGTLTKSSSNSFTGVIRLPAILRYDYSFLALDEDDEASSIGDSNSSTDDPMVDRSFRRESSDGNSLFIMSIANDSSPMDDSRLLESRINAEPILNFGNTYSPFVGSAIEALTGIIEDAGDIGIFDKHFNELLEDEDGVIFRLSLLNLLYSVSRQLYPYLEYQLSFANEVSDIFYNIKSLGKYGNYEVQLLTRVPTMKESILRSFTVIF